MSHEPPSILSTCLGFTPLLSRATARPFLALLPDSWRAAFCLGFYLAQLNSARCAPKPRVALSSPRFVAVLAQWPQASCCTLKPSLCCSHRTPVSSLALRPQASRCDLILSTPCLLCLSRPCWALGSLAFHPWAFYLSLFEPLPWVESLVRGWGLLLVVG